MSRSIHCHYSLLCYDTILVCLPHKYTNEVCDTNKANNDHVQFQCVSNLELRKSVIDEVS